MEPLLHFIIPFTFLTLAGVRFKTALTLSILAVLPDLDALLQVHRSLTHSAVVLTLLVASAWLITCKTRIQVSLPLTLLTVISHPILDLFTGYTPILWPLTQSSLQVQAELTVHIGSFPTLGLTLRLYSCKALFNRFQSLDAPLFTSEGLITSTMLIAPIMGKMFRERLLHRFSRG